MNGFMNRIARLRESLGTAPAPVVLTYANGEQRSMGIIEAIQEVGTRLDIVDVESEGETAASLLKALVAADKDFDSLPELAEEYNDQAKTKQT